MSWLLFDLHGSVAAVCPAASTTLSDAYRYDGFGQQIASSGTVTNPWRYRGLLNLTNDFGIGALLDMGARDYAPQLGVFTQEDSVQGGSANPMTMNRFLYALADPATLVDPDGHRTTDGGGGGGVIGSSAEPAGSGSGSGSAEPVGLTGSGTPKPNVAGTPPITNDVIDLPKGSTAAWKSLDPTNLYHSFTNIVENYGGYATKVGLPDGKVKYLLEGWLTKGKLGEHEIVEGVFEWVVEGGLLVHRFFNPD